MSSVRKFLSLCSAQLAPQPAAIPELLKAFSLGEELFLLLRERNGFYAFESALHVFPLGPTFPALMDIETWNRDSLWKDCYRGLADNALFFGEDVFQDQFGLADGAVVRFKAETGERVLIASSMENWAVGVLSDYKKETGWPIASEWQHENGPLKEGERLMPKIPFFLGGRYAIDNLWVGDSVEGLRFKSDIAVQTKNLPDGAQVRLRIRSGPDGSR